ncbi:MAG: family 78 glycoside hydrolase catalytic domain [Victivallales bacterium]|nr:family 78 glycoside hydrolase catalytic domain [Victivallales bacterium]
MIFYEAKWLAVPDEINRFWIFGKAFDCENDCEAVLEIAADKDLEAWLNGDLLRFSQLADLQRIKSVTSVKVNLKAGRNTLNVQVYNMGKGFALYDSRSKHGMAAIVYDESGKALCATDESWKFRRNDAYLPLTDAVTPQLGYCFCYDARKENDWHNSEVDGDAAVPVDAGYEYKLRELPPLLEKEIGKVRLVQYGFFKRCKTEGTFADICASDFLCSVFYDKFLKVTDFDYMEPERFRHFTPGEWRTVQERPDGTDGAYVIYDLGRECVGFIELNICASAGTIVDIAHGEHLDDGRVRCNISGRNFADRYICRDGENCFTHRMRRLGGRYIELHITNYTGELKIGFTSFNELRLPLPKASEFDCEDSRLLKLREIGIDTLVNCMHEHYEDCPWREQALYAYDSRNQALYGYYVWGNYDFAKACFTMLGDNYMGDGQIAITAPREHDLAIESFSLVWVSEIYELYLHSGDKSVAERNSITIYKVIDSALSRFDEATGLYRQSKDDKIWLFFEWVKGLAGAIRNTDGYEPFHALYNAYLLETLKSANAMFDGKYEKEARALQDAILRNFYDENSGYFKTLLSSELMHQHTQALMLMNGILPKDASRLFKAYCDPSLVAVSFSSMPFFLRAWMETTPEARKYIEQMVYDQFGNMLDSGATSFWETDNGGDAFYYAGSLNHAWSSLPVFYCHRYVLGVEPLEPGFRKFRVRPYPGRLTHASGTVPTPYGDIAVSWKTDDYGSVRLNVKHSAKIEMVVDSFPEFPVELTKEWTTGK